MEELSSLRWCSVLITEFSHNMMKGLGVVVWLDLDPGQSLNIAVQFACAIELCAVKQL